MTEAPPIGSRRLYNTRACRDRARTPDNPGVHRGALGCWGPDPGGCWVFEHPTRSPPIDPISPDGTRLVVRSERRGVVRHEAWSTANGRHLGDVPLQGECFELSPDGQTVADKRGDALALLPLP